MRRQLAFFLLAIPPFLVANIAYFVFHVSLKCACMFGFFSSFGFCDVWYFIRFTIGTFKNSLGDRNNDNKKRYSIFDWSVRKGRVLLNDIDRNGHCNNARFLRECGFGRRDLWHNNGVWRVINENGGNLVVGSQTIRYRRELSFGEKYEMRTRLLCWDERAFYVEHRFVTQTKTHGEFINAIVIVKNTVLGALGPEKIISKLPHLKEMESKNPPMTPDIQAWIESNKHSSTLLRNKTK